MSVLSWMFLNEPFCNLFRLCKKTFVLQDIFFLFWVVSTFIVFLFSLATCDNYFSLSVSSTFPLSLKLLWPRWVFSWMLHNFKTLSGVSVILKTLTIYSLTILANIRVGYHLEMTSRNRLFWLRFIAVRPGQFLDTCNGLK